MAPDLLVSAPLLEHQVIARLVEGMARSPLQLNSLHESDAELIRLPGTELILAITTDALVEEIETGLYDDPYLLGWMTVLVNASDLAAVGAEPLGVLVSATLPPDPRDARVARLQLGLRDATAACGLALLGGDTSLSARLHLAATAVGVVPDGRPVTRLGCSPGDRLLASGPLGLGTAFALARLGRRRPGKLEVPDYRPAPRLREGALLRGTASAAMDTSDGALATLDELMCRNDVGFRLDAPLERVLHPDALRLADAASLPPWMLLAGPHGEFELLFTVPAARRDALLAAAHSIGWRPLELGSVTSERRLELPVNGRSAVLDSGLVRRLFTKTGADVDRYAAELFRIHADIAPVATPV